MRPHRTDSSRTSSDRPTLYCWVPGVTTFVTSNGQLQIRSHERESLLKIDGAPNNDFLSLLSRHLKQPISLEQLERISPTPYRSILRQTIIRLVEIGLVIGGPNPLAESDEGSLARKCRIGLVGQTLLVTVVQQALTSAGFESELVINDAMWPDAIENGTRTRVLASLQLLSNDVERDDSELILLAIAGIEPQICRELGKYCAQTRIPWALFRYSGNRFEVGPLVIPGETACFDCLTLRALAASEDYEAEIEFMQYLADPHHETPAARPSRALLQLGASVLVAEMESFRLAGHASICNGVWIIRPDPVRLTLHRLLKIPGCPSCVLARGALAGAVCQ